MNKHGKQLTFIAAVRVICASLLILILPRLSEAQCQTASLTIAITGFNPEEKDTAEGRGVFSFAKCQAKAEGGKVQEIKLDMKEVGIKNVVDLGLDVIVSRLKGKGKEQNV